MSNEKLSEKEIKEVFDKLNIENVFNEKHFQVWEIPPVKKTTYSFTK